MFRRHTAAVNFAGLRQRLQTKGLSHGFVMLRPEGKVKTDCL